MSTGAQKREIKRKQIRKLFDLVNRFEQVILVSLENVGSNQVQMTRKALDKKNATLCIFKNTVARKAINLLAQGCKREDVDTEEEYQYYSRFQTKPQLLALSNLMKKKVGLIFTDTPAFELKEVIEANKVQAPARTGILAPISVSIPAGPTSLDPSQISFFHALSISTKIQKGQIEILSEVKVCVAGTLVTASQAALLEKLNIKPFQYGMEIYQVYDDGAILTPAQACVSAQQVHDFFRKGANNITGLSLALGIANELSVPHLITNAFKNILGAALGSGYKLPILDTLQAQAPVQQTQAKVETKKEEPKKEEKKKVEEPVEEEDMGFGGLF